MGKKKNKPGLGDWGSDDEIDPLQTPSSAGKGDEAEPGDEATDTKPLPQPQLARGKKAKKGKKKKPGLGDWSDEEDAAAPAPDAASEPTADSGDEAPMAAAPMTAAPVRADSGKAAAKKAKKGKKGGNGRLGDWSDGEEPVVVPAAVTAEVSEDEADGPQPARGSGSAFLALPDEDEGSATSDVGSGSDDDAESAEPLQVGRTVLTSRRHDSACDGCIYCNACNPIKSCCHA